MTSSSFCHSFVFSLSPPCFLSFSLFNLLFSILSHILIDKIRININSFVQYNFALLIIICFTDNFFVLSFILLKHQLMLNINNINLNDQC